MIITHFHNYSYSDNSLVLHAYVYQNKEHAETTWKKMLLFSVLFSFLRTGTFVKGQLRPGAFHDENKHMHKSCHTAALLLL